MDWKSADTRNLQRRRPGAGRGGARGAQSARLGAYETARAEGRSHDEAERDIVALLAEWRRPRSNAAPAAAPAHRVEPARDGVNLLAGVVQDARHGLRLLRREPDFALVAILTLRSESARRRRCSAWSTACCSGRCRGRIPIGSSV
jgi:hypothetical protein